VAVSRERASSSQRAERPQQTAVGLTPLYERLPHGPHRLERGEVLSHQRARIQGAMVEAIAQSGYEATSVKHVTALAGVSRRAFYEQFANKQDCFLATFDLIAGRGLRRVRRAYLAADGCLEVRLRAASAELARATAADPKSAALVAVAALSAGRAGIARQRSASAVCEQLLARSFTESAGSAPPPAPLLRAIAGALQGTLRASLCAAAGPSAEELTEELLRWTLLARGVTAAGTAERMAAVAAGRLRGARPRPSASSPAAVRERPGGGDGARASVLRAALRLGVLGDYLELSAPQVAEEASVPVEAFFELFADTGECYAAALEMLAETLLGIASDAELTGEDWPRAVRRVLLRTLSHLAANPLQAHTLAHGAFAAGPGAVRRNLELAEAVAELLTAGAPAGRRSRLVVAGVAGAVWHTIGCQTAGGRVELLPVISDYLAYVVLAPLIGAEAAARVVTEPQAA